MGPEPGQEGGGVAFSQGFVDAIVLINSRLVKLGCIKAPQAVGREIAKAAVAPVDILEASLLIVRDVDTQPGGIVLLPPAGDIVNRERPFYEAFSNS